MTFVPTPGELAYFDQRWASTENMLDALIEAYEGIAENIVLRPEFRVVNFSVMLRDEMTDMLLADLLVCAIERLMRSEEQ